MATNKKCSDDCFYLGGSFDPVPHVINNGLGSRGSAGKLPCGNYFGTALLDSRDKLGVQPLVVTHSSTNRGTATVSLHNSVICVRVLSRGVVA